MYRQLLIAGLVAGASLTAGGIAVWTMEKSPAQLHSDLGHKLKPIARSVQTASWNEHGRAALAPVAVAPAAAGRHAVPVEAPAPAARGLLAVSTATAAEPDLPAATKGAGHCALTNDCTPGVATGNGERSAGGVAAPLGAAGALPFAAPGAPVAQGSAAPATVTAPAPSFTMLLADTTPVAATTIVEAVEYGRTGGPRDVLGQAQEVPGSSLPTGDTVPASTNPSASAPDSAGSPNASMPFISLAPTQPPGSPAATPGTPSAPIVEPAGGPQLVPQLNPTSPGQNAPLLEQAVSAAADNAVVEPSTNILLLVAMLGAAVMVRRRVP